MIVPCDRESKLIVPASARVEVTRTETPRAARAAARERSDIKTTPRRRPRDPAEAGRCSPRRRVIGLRYYVARMYTRSRARKHHPSTLPIVEERATVENASNGTTRMAARVRQPA